MTSGAPLSPIAPPGLPAGQTGVYQPGTGNGGSGTIKGGNAGNIGAAGIAGDGGTAIITAQPPSSPPPGPVSAPNINLDRVLVNGGRAGHDPSYFKGVVIPVRRRGAQLGIGGNGGSGDSGGNGGSVGGGVDGGDGGKIEVTAAGAITRSVDFRRQWR